ncbi:Hsp20 family protein [Pseudomonadota bacterium]
MRNIDLTPLHSFTIGFDRMQRELDRLAHQDNAAPAYPPYNIEVLTDDEYRITMAVAGFGESDLDIQVEANELTVSGRIESTEEDVKFLHRGIATRTFQRRFALADHIKIKGAKLANGLLHIELEREVPDALKPRKISISAAGADAIEHKAA